MLKTRWGIALNSQRKFVYSWSKISIADRYEHMNLRMASPEISWRQEGIILKTSRLFQVTRNYPPDVSLRTNAQHRCSLSYDWKDWSLDNPPFLQQVRSSWKVDKKDRDSKVIQSRSNLCAGGGIGTSKIVLKNWRDKLIEAISFLQFS